MPSPLIDDKAHLKDAKHRTKVVRQSTSSRLDGEVQPEKAPVQSSPVLQRQQCRVGPKLSAHCGALDLGAAEWRRVLHSGPSNHFAHTLAKNKPTSFPMSCTIR